jgi:hypothetical protein
VILVGDTLFGKTVADVQFVNGLNDDGAIAFFYGLGDDVSGVALAVVPEPSTGLGLSTAAGTICLLRRRRRARYSRCCAAGAITRISA